MIRVVRADVMQFIQQLFCDYLRLGMFHAMNHPMSHRFDRRELWSGFEPVYQGICRRFVICGGKFATSLWFAIGVVKRQISPAQADAVNLSMKPTFQWFANVVERKLDAGGTTVDGQDACVSWFHG
jgi:hypothetical protein